MKKLICMLMITSMLFGCGVVETENSPVIEETTLIVEPPTIKTERNAESDDGVVALIDEETSSKYGTIEAFKNSEFYNQIKTDGFTPYLLEYDEERYTFQKMNTDAKWYSYVLYDKVADKNITYTLKYDRYIDNIEDLSENNLSDRNFASTAERNGVTYEVYLSTSAYKETDNFFLHYVPVEGYIASMNAEQATSDEILEYFDDFELVAET